MKEVYAYAKFLAAYKAHYGRSGSGEFAVFGEVTGMGEFRRGPRGPRPLPPFLLDFFLLQPSVVYGH